MTERSKRAEEREKQVPLNPEPLGPNPNPSLDETEQTAFPPEAGPGQPAVQVNVEEDLAIGGGSYPVHETANGEYRHPRRQTALILLVAIVVALFLAVPVIWLLAEIVLLSGILGSWLWVWVVLLVVLVAATVIIAYGVAESGL